MLPRALDDHHRPRGIIGHIGRIEQVVGLQAVLYGILDRAVLPVRLIESHGPYAQAAVHHRLEVAQVGNGEHLAV
jgi:hypothetical protein